MKKEYAILISELLGIDPPEDIPGGTISKDWILSAVRQVPGCEEIDGNLTKADLLKTAIEELGGTWDEECQSEGGTITTTALSKLVSGIEPRIIQMKEIWALLGRAGLPSADHDGFVATLFGHYFDREMPSDSSQSIHEIINHIDENHGLSEEEIWTEDGASLGAYQVILNDLFTEPSEEEDDEDEEEIKGIISTSVDATQIATLVNYYEWGTLDLNPPWQRGDVWTPKKKKSVVESILLNIPLPALILHTRKDGRIEVIDGQQRLRSIMQFVDNKFALPKFKSGHDLADISGCWWDTPKKKHIGHQHRMMFLDTKIPVLNFKNVNQRTLRKVFNLYNTAALKLNPAEIRNATYQTHSLHQMAFILAGENFDAEIWYVDEEKQKEFTSDWRELSGNSRFASTERICQYFAYSRPQRPPNSSVFKGISTKAAINRLLDNIEPSEDEILELTQELIDVYYFAEEYFDLDDGINHAFERNNKDGIPKFNKLIATTNLVASRLLIGLLSIKKIEEDNISESIQSVMNNIEFPDNQNAGTIWQYQADVINGLLDYSNISSDDPEVVSLFPNLVPCMNEIRRTD